MTNVDDAIRKQREEEQKAADLKAAFTFAAQLTSGLDPVAVQVAGKYGYLAGFLNHPEIGPLLRQAATSGWTKETLQGALFKTQWWQANAAGWREFDVLLTSDYMEANRRIHHKAVELATLASQEGVAVDWKQLTDLAELTLRMPMMSEAEMRQHLFAGARWSGATPQGRMGAAMYAMKGRAAEYLVPMADNTTFEWAKKIAQGLITPEAVEVFLRDTAKSRWSQFSDQIDRGLSVRQIVDPYIQQTANLLEVAPETIDITNPKYMAMIEQKDADTGQASAMSLTDAATYIRRTEEYGNTQQARAGAAAFGENLLRTMGEVKV
jgi:hypothetical protein